MNALGRWFAAAYPYLLVALLIAVVAVLSYHIGSHRPPQGHVLAEHTVQIGQEKVEIKVSEAGGKIWGSAHWGAPTYRTFAQLLGETSELLSDGNLLTRNKETHDVELHFGGARFVFDVDQPCFRRLRQ